MTKWQAKLIFVDFKIEILQLEISKLDIIDWIVWSVSHQWLVTSGNLWQNDMSLHCGKNSL